MAIRERLKKTFRRNSTSGTGSEESSTTEHRVYQPGEKIPQSKYRRPVAKEHKEKLEAFSFANAWRRKSNGSTYSPMGSRMPSRKNSAEPQVGRRSRSFVQSVAEEKDEENDVGNGKCNRKYSALIDISSDLFSDISVVVGVSRDATADHPPPRKPAERPLSSSQAKDFASPDPEAHNANTQRHDTPFASAELAKKLSHLAIPSTS
jgi:hypothetical protein